MKPQLKTQLKERLSAEAYGVCCLSQTERAFSGEYNSCTDHGIYHCQCCDQALFNSEHKYDSGTGWPSFWAPVDSQAVTLRMDRSLFMRARTEVICSKCEAHLGHVFDDGPEPTGKRFCMNSVALKLYALNP